MKPSLIRPSDMAESSAGTAPAGLPDVEAARAKRLAQIPLRQRPIFLRAWKGQSRKSAMRAFCLECMGYQSAEVNRCTSLACTLYGYRESGR